MEAAAVIDADAALGTPLGSSRELCGSIARSSGQPKKCDMILGAWRATTRLQHSSLASLS